VSTELTARAADLLALIQHDMQAAEFGTATAAFFNAIDQGQPAGTQKSSSDAGSLTGSPPATVGSTSAPSNTNAQAGAAAASKTAPARAGTPPTLKK
jgi:hypothetical protein